MTTPLAMPKKSASVEKQHNDKMDEFFELVMPDPDGYLDTETAEAVEAESAKAAKPAPPKKPFVPKPHLTQRPFRNPELDALRSTLRKQESKIQKSASYGKKARA